MPDKPLTVIYSFNKRGFEERYWTKEISAASTPSCRFIPFNHGAICDPSRYLCAQDLDNLYFRESKDLLLLYDRITEAIIHEKADVLLVDNCFPYHPDFLADLKIHRVIRTTDGPLSAYKRDLAYIHSYDQILYHSPGHSKRFTMADKLASLRAPQADFWPLAAHDAMRAPGLTIDCVDSNRDIDIIFVGSLSDDKLATIASVKKAFGRRCRIFGQTSLKRSIYFSLRYGYPGLVTPVPFEDIPGLYRRAKIGFNIHNRGRHTIGSYRLFDLPANGVMQISDGSDYLSDFFVPDREIVGYEHTEALITLIDRYLTNDLGRRDIARAGFERVERSHRFFRRMEECEALLRTGIATTRARSKQSPSII